MIGFYSKKTFFLIFLSLTLIQCGLETREQREFVLNINRCEKKIQGHVLDFKKLLKEEDPDLFDSQLINYRYLVLDEDRKIKLAKVPKTDSGFWASAIYLSGFYHSFLMGDFGDPKLILTNPNSSDSMIEKSVKNVKEMELGALNHYHTHAGYYPFLTLDSLPGNLFRIED